MGPSSFGIIEKLRNQNATFLMYPTQLGSSQSAGSSFSMSNLLSSASDDSQLDAQGGIYLNANAVSQSNFHFKCILNILLFTKY